MSKMRWFDRNGVELHEGDIIRDVDSGKEERVYACHPADCPEGESLGVNASNERWLELHPEYPREIYPFTNFEHLVTVEGHGCVLTYEKVV